MKIVLIACLASLALWVTPTQGGEAPVQNDVPVVEVPAQVILEDDPDDDVIEVEDEDDLDVKRMLQDLFHYNYNEDKKTAEREGRELESEDEVEEDLKTRQTVFDPTVISKYNGFVDAFLNRLSDAMRLNNDPMRLVIRQGGKFETHKTNKGRNNKKFQGLKRNNGKKESKRGKLHPKDVSADTGEQVPVEEGSSARNKREIPSETDYNLEDYEYYDDEEAGDYEEDLEGLEGRALDTESDLAYDDEYVYDDYEEYEDGEQGLQSAREGKSITTVEEGEGNKDADDGDLVEGRRRGPRQRRRRRRRKGGRRRRKCGQFCQRRRKRLRRRRLRNRRRGKRSAETAPSVIISGISNIKRVGDVRVFDRENSQDIVSDFGVGPVVLKAQKSYGKGTQSDIRQAEAMAPLVMGEVVINLNRRGDARVKRMKLLRPTAIQVTGSLRKKQGLNSDKAMESFVRRTRPAVSRAMKKAATRIFRIAKNSNNKNNGFSF